MRETWIAALTVPVLLGIFAGLTGTVAAAPPVGAGGPVWSVSPNPNPAGSTATALNDVSCPTKNRCFAVSNYSTGSATKTLVEQSTGTKWSIATSPNPAASTFSGLNGVSCPSPSNCFAVGYHSSGTHYETLIEHWNGSIWSIMTSPNATGATFNGLNEVSCPSANSCFTVGYSSIDTEARTLVEHWNGRHWSIMTSPNPAGSFSTSLSGISCPSPNRCFAVGNYLPSPAAKTLVEYWNGSSWRIVASPKLTGSFFAVLTDVSCPSTTTCFAVGYNLTASHYQTLVERWNGRNWSITPSPDHPGSYSTVLNGVSCPSTTTCFAVGNYATAPTTKTLAERWNGTSWSIMTSPNPIGASSTSLSRVSCANPNSCFAVGSATNTLIEQYG